MAASAYAVSLPLLLWMAPVVVGLLLAVPIAMLSSTAGSGSANRRSRLFSTPEQTVPPRVLIRANELANASRENNASPVHELRNDPGLLSAHLMSLSVKPRNRGQIDPHLAIARAKIEDAESFDEALGYLSSREIFAVLNSPTILRALVELPAAASKGGPEAIQNEVRET
jgi:membrane glycosyltransferase